MESLLLRAFIVAVCGVSAVRASGMDTGDALALILGIVITIFGTCACLGIYARKRNGLCTVVCGVLHSGSYRIIQAATAFPNTGKEGHLWRTRPPYRTSPPRKKRTIKHSHRKEETRLNHKPATSQEEAGPSPSLDTSQDPPQLIGRESRKQNGDLCQEDGPGSNPKQAAGRRQVDCTPDVDYLHGRCRDAGPGVDEHAVCPTLTVGAVASSGRAIHKQQQKLELSHKRPRQIVSFASNQ
ncbi:hypothetical protein HPB48_016135 [Haemaphysalis longicornis]|uniref:Uncharacterized protein n=1 Tax=Haemaphysalis longicornis TaxID=44386 RepID=A0A9J6FP00_HAELO|nr:hypothetical protein HPB48_016135 [Haemaphysalis longicornis]